MDREEAARLLSDHLTQFRSLTYAELAAHIGIDEYMEVVGESKISYQIEIQFMWDGAEGGDIRVSAGIDDGSLRGAFRPVCEDFVITPKGRLIGE